MTKFKLLLLVLLLLGKSIIYGQERTITGKVTDESNRTPVAGATVLVKGARNAVTTNGDGVFSIKAPSGTVTLVISSIGFATKQISAGPSSDGLAISLSTDTRQLGEVVVTALGITRQAKTLTYATQTIKAQ